MSTTAVIYSGQTRTFGQVFENQYWHVLRKLPNPEFFVSVQDDAQAADMTRLWEKFPQEKVHIEYVEQPTIPEPKPDPKWLNLYPPSSPPQAILRQLWALNRAWDFVGEFQHLEKFKAVVRIRSDLAFTKFDAPAWNWLADDACLTPWWGRWGGVNDRFAVMGLRAASAYFNTSSVLHRLLDSGCPFHPEQLIAASLEHVGIAPTHTLAAEFITVRLDGTVVPMSITELDAIYYSRSSI